MRKSKSITQEELSEMTGLSVRTIQRIETGEVNPRAYSLRQLASALGFEINSLPSQVSSSNTTPSHQTLALRVAQWSFGLAFLAPFNIFIHLLIRYRYRSQLQSNPLALRIISFQVLWVLLQLFSVFLTPLLSHLIMGQSMSGQFPIHLLVFVFLSIVNGILTLNLISKINNKATDILSRIPVIL